MSGRIRCCANAPPCFAPLLTMSPLNRLLFLPLAIAPLLASLASAGEAVVTRPKVLSLTLDTAIRMALRKNFSIQVEELGPQAAKERVTSALGRFDPTFDLSLQRAENT